MKNAILRLRGKQGRGDVAGWGGNEIGSMSQFHWDISVGDSWAFTVHDITILGARRNLALANIILLAPMAKCPD